jgi:XTP/dITP diphosphohydrolase
MQTLVLATGNPHKVEEIQEVLAGRFQIKGLKDINCPTDLPETSDTLEGNALQKARYVYEHYQLSCFAEDTGLEIEALGGEPGVYTARYAGPQKDPDDNMSLVLQKLRDKTNRRARFRTVVALIIDGREHTFEGIVNGTIAYQKQGSGGFGYDPIFIPEGYEQTFAQLPSSEKNKISHRGRAVRKLIVFLQS